MSLADLYNQIVETDEEIEKIAAQEAIEEVLGSHYGNDDEAVKLASEYDAAGRILARGFFDEMLKEAQAGMEEEDEEKEEKEEDKEDKKKKKKGLPAALQAALAEKKAAYIEAMQNDPDYAAQLIAHFTESE
jgi:hypothetical protein